MGFPKQECWSGLPFPSPGDLPDSRVETTSPASSSLQADSLPLSHQGSPTIYIVVVQSLSRVWLFATLWTAAHHASLSFTISLSLLKLMSIELMVSSNHLILSCPLLMPSIFPSIRVFFTESALHIREPKYWSFSFSISPFNECPELISFKIDWFDLLAVQETLRSLLQHHSSKAYVIIFFSGSFPF